MAFMYEGANTREISFPLGGIGTGCIGLAGNGRLIDWEIFNRPNKGSVNGMSHFAVRAEKGGEVLDRRVLNADLPGPYTGDLTGGQFQSYGFGPRRQSLAGAPHFRDVVFRGEFPIAELRFEEDHFPGQALMRAFNPLIPNNPDDSGLPAAFFEAEITNTTESELTYTVALVVQNPQQDTVNKARTLDGIQTIHLGSADPQPRTPAHGELTIATDAPTTSYQECLFRGSWFDQLGVYWQDLGKAGPFENRSYEGKWVGARAGGGRDQALLAGHQTVAPGETARMRFVIAWYYPNCVNYWKPDPQDSEKTWKNHYATRFGGSGEVASFAVTNWDRLFAATERFHDALYSSTLPDAVLDAVAANISILKTPTVLRLEDGTLYGFEGCHPDTGCCEGTCQHVWNYAYALPFLFPSLERSIRDSEFLYNLGPDGDMTFRLQLPLGRDRTSFRPCADGQFGAVIKTYREWKICGDTEWLKGHWESIKQALAYAWSEENPDRWDRDHDGVLEGRQHHTLDMELFGPNSWLTGFYLAALKAGAEMARYLDESKLAEEYEKLFERGKSWVDANLFNGEYYVQQIDLHDRDMLETYPEEDERIGRAVDAYWDEEHGQMKYQIDQGCIIDQVLAQWHANLVGLGDIFDPAHVKKALQSIYKYNYRETMRDFFNPCRLYALNDEAGTIICSFPKGQPVIPIPYAEETMHGYEYQVGCHMIREGMYEQGLNVVRAVRDRYAGDRRNPWNEIECGSNYARSMASYGLLLTYSGFEFDMSRGHVGFGPIIGDGDFRCFWSLEGAWGSFTLTPQRAELMLEEGSLRLESLGLGGLGTAQPRAVTCGGAEVPWTWEKGALSFAAAVTATADKPIVVELAE